VGLPRLILFVTLTIICPLHGLVGLGRPSRQDRPAANNGKLVKGERAANHGREAAHLLLLTLLLLLLHETDVAGNEL
jgi:hypothetical protein